MLAFGAVPSHGVPEAPVLGPSPQHEEAGGATDIAVTRSPADLAIAGFPILPGIPHPLAGGASLQSDDFRCSLTPM